MGVNPPLLELVDSVDRRKRPEIKRTQDVVLVVWSPRPLLFALLASLEFRV